MTDPFWVGGAKRARARRLRLQPFDHLLQPAHAQQPLYANGIPQAPSATVNQVRPRPHKTNR